MSLQAKLDAYKASFEEKAPQEALQVMHKVTHDLKTSGILDTSIKSGQELPAFSLKNQEGETKTLANYLANGPLVISFFRGIWCPYCKIELDALNEAVGPIENLGAKLITISPQLPSNSSKLVRDHSLKFDILTDEGNAYAKELKTVFALPEDLKALYTKFGINLPVVNGDESWTLPMPTRLVIDQKGIVRYADINPDYTVRPEIEDALKVLEELKVAA